MNIPHLGPKDYTPLMDNVAPTGWIWQCQACGKKTRDRYTDQGGWDEACMLNAALIETKEPDDRPLP